MPLALAAAICGWLLMGAGPLPERPSAVGREAPARPTPAAWGDAERTGGSGLHLIVVVPGEKVTEYTARLESESVFRTALGETPRPATIVGAADAEAAQAIAEAVWGDASIVGATQFDAVIVH